MPDASRILSTLGAGGYRLTEPRRALADLIAGRNGHFTADDLIAASKRRRLGVGRATVFRSLDILAGLGIVERLDLPSGEHAFVTCEPAHHHHIVCSGCGRSTDIEDSGLASLLDDVGRRSGFHIESHRLVLFGVCPACQAVPDPGT